MALHKAGPRKGEDSSRRRWWLFIKKDHVRTKTLLGGASGSS